METENKGTDSNGNGIGNGDVRGVPLMEASTTAEANEAVKRIPINTDTIDALGRGEIGFDDSRVRDRPGVIGGSEFMRFDNKSKVLQTKDGEKRFCARVVDAHILISEMLKAGKQISEIAEKIGVERHVVGQYIHANEDLENDYKDQLDKKLDMMENVVLNIATTDAENTITEAGAFSRYDGRVLTANLNAAKFWLERLGAKRGWNAKLETNEVGNGGRVPMIFLGDVNEEMIAEAEAQVAAANKAAGVGNPMDNL